jgi:hypothetical protein
MTENGCRVLSFPSAWNFIMRRALRQDLLAAMRGRGSSVILDLSNRHTLNHEDIAVLLDCAALVAGRDIQLLVVAGSRSNRVLLQVARIAAVLPVCNSMEEARAHLKHQANQDQVDQDLVGREARGSRAA